MILAAVEDERQQVNHTKCEPKKKGALLGSQSPKFFTPNKSEINICSQFQ
jgi:hypothetical protein